MSDKTGIQWTDATWNPLRGCTPVSDGCRHCYAMKIASRFPWGANVARGGKWTGKVELVESALTDPLRWTRPRRIFVNSMSDLFHERVPDEWIDRIFAVMALARHHTFQILTKRPERMRAYMRDWPGMLRRVGRHADSIRLGASIRVPWRNVWLGVSVEDQETADERVPLLLQTPAAVRFVSYEPALGPVDLQSLRGGEVLDREGAPHLNALRGATYWPEGDHGANVPRLDWIIVGGESGPGARPCEVAWIRSTIKQCREAGVAVFVKQLGAHILDRNDAQVDGEGPRDWPAGTATEEWYDDPRRQYQGAPMRVHLRDRKGGDMAEWPEDLRVREFPAVGGDS